LWQYYRILTEISVLYPGEGAVISSVELTRP